MAFMSPWCSIDRDTGAATVERYAIAYDVGRAVNPMLVEGQLVGGFAQGLGGALSEEFVYDERGEPLSTTLRRLSRSDRTGNPAGRGAAHARTRRARAIRSASRAPAKAA